MGMLILEPSWPRGPLGMEAVDRWPRVPGAVSSAQGGLGENGVYKAKVMLCPAERRRLACFWVLRAGGSQYSWLHGMGESEGFCKQQQDLGSVSGKPTIP